MIIYRLAGLGFDRRAFQKLDFPKDAEIHEFDWMDPLPKEAIEDYAARMIQTQMNAAHQKEEVYLIGHSFGGVMMQEVAQQIEQAKGIIILSSIKAHEEKPWIMRWFYWLPVWALTIKFFIWLSFPLWARFYGYRTKSSRKLFREMVARFSDRYYIWATKTIAHWKPKADRKLPPVLSIHGTADQMFYYRNIKAPKKAIKGGNHFMLYHKAEQVSPLIQAQLQSWEEEAEIELSEKKDRQSLGE